MLNRADTFPDFDLVLWFTMTYLFARFLKDSIQMLGKLIFVPPTDIFVLHITDAYCLISILFIFIGKVTCWEFSGKKLLVLCISGFASSGCGFVNLFMIKFKLKGIQ